MELDEHTLQALQNQLDAAMNILESFVNSCADKFACVDLDELAKFYSKKMDDLILHKESEEELKYVGGTFAIDYVTQETFSLNLELYFKDNKDEWVKMKSSSAKPTKYLKERALNELFEKKKVSYDVEHPNEKDGAISKSE